MCNTVNMKNRDLFCLKGNLTLFYLCKVQKLALFSNSICLRELVFSSMPMLSEVHITLLSPAVFKVLHSSVKAEFI